MKRLITIITLLLATGCATSTPYWERTWEGAVTTDVVAVDVRTDDWGIEPYGWTKCDKVKRHCTIYVMRSAEDFDCVVEHEKKHAAGLDHPHYRRAFICTFRALSIL